MLRLPAEAISWNQFQNICYVWIIYTPKHVNWKNKNTGISLKWKTEATYFAENDFWRQILWCPTQRPGPAFYPLGKSKVCHLHVRSRYTPYISKAVTLTNQSNIIQLLVVAHLNVAVVVNEKVLRFQISVYEI